MGTWRHSCLVVLSGTLRFVTTTVKVSLVLCCLLDEDTSSTIKNDCGLLGLLLYVADRRRRHERKIWCPTCMSRGSEVYRFPFSTFPPRRRPQGGLFFFPSKSAICKSFNEGAVLIETILRDIGNFAILPAEALLVSNAKVPYYAPHCLDIIRRRRTQPART